MKKFIGREQELAALEKRYQADGFQMLVMYGRRRVGKSTLLQKFVEGRNAVFYTAIRSGVQRNLELLSHRVTEALAPDMSGMTFPSYEALFSFLGKAAADKRLVFVIDELPYLVEQEPDILSVLQKSIDKEWLSGQLFLILCGSSISFMENDVLSEKSPLFGRRTAQMHLLPFSYLDAGRFVPSWAPEDKAVCFGVTGGIAKYLALFDETESLEENLVRLFFSKDGYLYEEPENLLVQEYRNTATYSAIIEAVAAGRTKLSEIADLTHLDATTVAHAARNLLSTGILKKRYAITDERNKRKVRYELSDHMFRFWYRFVPRAIDAIEMGGGGAYYAHVVAPLLTDYMGPVFEDMCCGYTLRMGLSGALPSFVTRVGKWWGTNPRNREETDIDIVALDDAQKTAMLGECKFRNEPLDVSVLEQLQERNGLIDHRYRVTAYLLFAKRGFSAGVREKQKMEALVTKTLADLYEGM